MPNDRAPVPDIIPGEPASRVPSAPRLAALLLARSLAALIATVLGAPLWPAYLLGNLLWGRPPHLPDAARVGRCLSLVLRGHPEPDLTPGQRVGLALEVARRTALRPLWGLAWHLDTLLNGRELARVHVDQPLFEVSAARSGSTQIARYLEKDTRLVAPAAVMALFPYLWLWRLAARCLPRGTAERVRAHVRSQLPPEFVERHELDPLRMDTFEILFSLFVQWGDIFLSLGPGPVGEVFTFATIPGETGGLWTADFPRFFDAVAQKTLLFHPSGKRLFIKGHFLHAAPALAQRYPTARFLTVLRDPARRTQSMVNFVRSHPTVAPSPHVPWPWILAQAPTGDHEYNAAEIAFFSALPPDRRCIVDFDDDVADLEGTLNRVYAEALHLSPPSVPVEHEPRHRAGYRIDRSLASLGLDTPALEAERRRFAAWRSRHRRDEQSAS